MTNEEISEVMKKLVEQDQENGKLVLEILGKALNLSGYDAIENAFEVAMSDSDDTVRNAFFEKLQKGIIRQFPEDIG